MKTIEERRLLWRALDAVDANRLDRVMAGILRSINGLAGGLGFVAYVARSKYRVGSPLRLAAEQVTFTLNLPRCGDIELRWCVEKLCRAHADQEVWR